LEETVKGPRQRKPRKDAVEKEVKEVRKIASPMNVNQGYPSGDNTGIVGGFETEMEVDP
jgi:hypothetical protein